jgi:hypothetical protein
MKTMLFDDDYDVQRCNTSLSYLVANSLVEVHFSLKHFSFNKSGDQYDSFNGYVEQIIVKEEGAPTPVKAYKRKNVREGPVRSKPAPFASGGLNESGVRPGIKEGVPAGVASDLGLLSIQSVALASPLVVTSGGGGSCTDGEPTACSEGASVPGLGVLEDGQASKSVEVGTVLNGVGVEKGDRPPKRNVKSTSKHVS